VLAAEGLRVGYGGVTALVDCGLEVPEGGCVAVLGANGAGKSTLLRTLARVLRQRAGDVRLDGRRINRWGADRAARHGIALVPEGRRLFAALSVRDNLVVGATRLPGSRVRQRLDHVVAIFPELEPRLGLAAARLSGGEQQMVAIGRALMGEPRVLLIDELSLGLAPAVVKRMYGVLPEINGEGLAVVVVEQYADLALRVAKQVLVLEKGRVVFSGAPDDLRSRGEVLETAYLGRAEREVALSAAPGSPPRQRRGRTAAAVEAGSNGRRLPAVAEVTVHLEGPMKRRAERAASEAGVDLDTWLARLVRRAEDEAKEVGAKEEQEASQT
jgi:branched-chain amino acid transport system ATP-binding protein